MCNVFIGYDPRDDLAAKVCEESLRDHSTVPSLQVHRLNERELRQKELYWRSYRVDGVGQMWDDFDGKPFSTQFSFTRFLVPALCGYRAGLSVFCDADFMWRGDIAEMLDGLEKQKALWCVHHQQRGVVDGELKMDGVIQTLYHRKNWSSLMVFDPLLNQALTPYKVSMWKGSQLHAMSWLEDGMIGEIPETWNWLEGHSDFNENPKVVHHTRGTPDMIGDDIAFADEWWKYAKR